MNTFVASRPQSKSNFNTTLAHMNQHIRPAHTAETIWLALVENPDAPLEYSLPFHIADALATRSHKRVLLVDMSGQAAMLAPHFAVYSDQLRPSLFECACDHSALRKHQAPTVTLDGRHYPAIATLLP